MDSLTQMVLGAGVGEALLGRKAGNRTILWGAVIATVPDLDVIPTAFMHDVAGNHFHRGFFHSISFFILASPLFGKLLERLYKNKVDASWWQWTNFSFGVLLTHSLLDCFTSWGTQLFWPYDYHIAWNTIFIVDPLYTVPFLIFIILAMRHKKESEKRWRLNLAGLVLSSTYLLLTVVNKQIVNSAFEESLAQQNIEYSRYSTKPTPFNNLLWFIMVEADSGYYMGYYSLLDADKHVPFQYIEKKHHLLKDLPQTDELKTLVHITDGYYCIEQGQNGLELHDLRFGQSTDFETNRGDFVFSFLLQKKDDRLEITQKEQKFPKGDEFSSLMGKLWRRMVGEKNG